MALLNKREVPLDLTLQLQLQMATSVDLQCLCDHQAPVSTHHTLLCQSAAALQESFSLRLQALTY